MNGTHRVIVTGSRRVTLEQRRYVWYRLEQALLPGMGSAWERLIIVEGECPTGGVDLVAREFGETYAHLGAVVEPHPADWKRYGSSAGPRRNAEMVAAKADEFLGFPGPGSRGTWDCIRRAGDAGIHGHIYPIQEA